MSVPDPAPPRKPRRLGLYLPFIIALVVGVAWSGYWFWLRMETGRQVDLMAEQLRKAGYEVSWQDQTVGGYPFRLNVNLTEATIRDTSGWALATPKLEAQAFLHGLGSWIVAAPQGLTFTRPQGGPVTVTGQTLRASVSGFDKRPPRISFEGVKLAFAPGAGAQPFAVSAAERVEFHLRPGPDDQAAVFVSVTAGKAQLSGLFGRIAGEKPVSLKGDAVLSKVSAFKGSDWRSAVRAWADGGGQATVKEAGLTAGEAMIGAQAGRLSVGSDGRLRGQLDVNLRQGPQALTALGETGAIPPDAAAAAAAVAQARQTTGEAARASLTFEAGQTTLGPVAVGPAPRIY